MIPGISSQIFLPKPLQTDLLDALRDGGAQAIELWAARHHIDYADRSAIKELARWFRSNDVIATLHAPLTTDTDFSRHASPNVNLLDSDRGRRIAAMDEIKRALEIAEQIPVRSCVIHLGQREDRWSEYTLEYAITALEHLNAFAVPLGVKLLLENLRNEVATPEHLLEILRIGHFDSCGICLDTGHAHLSEAGLPGTLAILRERLAELHVNDNRGTADDHLWPASGTERPGWAASGTLDWQAAYTSMAGLAPATLAILEIADTQARTPAEVTQLLREVLSHQARLLEPEAGQQA